MLGVPPETATEYTPIGENEWIKHSPTWRGLNDKGKPLTANCQHAEELRGWVCAVRGGVGGGDTELTDIGV